jgi:hypothetical protein
MPELPLEPITVAVYERLTGEDGAGHGIGETILYAGAQDAPARYVALQIPDTQTRETFDTEGWDVTLALRCHTEHPSGDRKPLEAMSLAGSAKASLEAAPLDIGPDHALLHLPTPRLVTTSYDIGEAARASDVTLRYDLMTQHLN